MTDNDRNTRTLILCFAILVMALIPLRFIEVGNQMTERQVLGETIQVQTSEEAQNMDAKLEVPYDQIDGSSIR